MLGLKKLGAMLSDAITPSYRMPADAVFGPTEDDKRRARELAAFEDARDGTLLGAPPWAAEEDPRDANWTPDEGDWMETALFNKFYFFKPTDDVIDIYDIGQSLGHTARFGGHYRAEIAFYSVAEHSYLLAEYANLKWGPVAGFEALMHDAAEAYVGDMIRPLKNSYPLLKEAEKVVEAAVRESFGLPAQKPDWMRELDHRMLAAERLKVKGKSTLHWAGEDITPLPISFRFFSPNRARDCFLDMFWQLNRDAKETGR
jgi:hypothetical protein